MTPQPEDEYTPMSSPSERMSMGHLRALTVTSEDADVHPAADLVSTREDMVADLIKDNISIMEVLAQLGANPRATVANVAAPSRHSCRRSTALRGSRKQRSCSLALVCFQGLPST